MSFLFDLIWKQTIVAYFQNWPYYGGDWTSKWGLFFLSIPFFGMFVSLMFFLIWSDRHHAKYPVNKDSGPEKELPKVPDGLFAFSTKEDSLFVKGYLEEFKRYPRSLCDYVPYCTGWVAIFGFCGLTFFGVLVLSSNLLFYWLWVFLYQVLLAMPWFITEVIPSIASLVTGFTVFVISDAFKDVVNSSIVTKIGAFLFVLSIVVFFLSIVVFLLRSRVGRATRLWVYSKAKRMCIPLRIIPAKK